MADSGMAVQLKASMRNLEAATSSAAQMAISLNKFSNKLNTKGGFADKVFTDTATFNKIEAAAAQLKGHSR